MHILALVTTGFAIEGMWEPSQLPALAPTLRAAGYLDDPARLGDLGNAPLGAVVSLGGCTASFVSDLGLLVTNHHCGTGMLQRAQKEGENLLESGFYAPTRADERSAGAMSRVWITDGFEDVTRKIKAASDKARDDRQRVDLTDDTTRKLVAACEKSGAYRCRVASFYEGERYTLIRQIELRDLRIVMAPPDMVGNYGDEVDNWHWPRHAGDFTFLRAYVGPDGEPAAYSPDNVPYAPRHRLAVSTRGISAGSFVMVAGYPGHTERWRAAVEVEQEAESTLPLHIKHATAVFDTLTATIEADPAASALVGPSRGSVGNGLFNAKGTLVAFRRGRMVEAARARDEALDAWIAADPARLARYRAPIDAMRLAVLSAEQFRARDALMDWLERNDLLAASRTMHRWSLESPKRDAMRELGYQKRDLDRARSRLVELQAGLHLPSERAIFEHFLTEILRLPPQERPVELMTWLGVTGAEKIDIAALVAATASRLFNGPVLADADARVAWLDRSAAEFASSTDPWISLAVALRPYDEAREERDKTRRGAELRTRPLYAEALRGMDPARTYPDANGTLRVSVGTVQGYAPRDAVTYGPQTTVLGLADKAGDWPFAAPKPLLDAIATGNWGPWNDPTLGAVPVNFLSDLDITGGNSGSPVLDGRGRLVGLAFDGNIEGIASDWRFELDKTRCISVDVRYVLWYLDAVQKADGLLLEMGVAPAI